MAKKPVRLDWSKARVSDEPKPCVICGKPAFMLSPDRDRPMMTETEAAWIREHAWLPAMRRLFASVPGYFTACACQYGMTRCDHGERCHRREPLVLPIGSILSADGEHDARHREPYAHPTPTATGPKRTDVAQVWYADRSCRWVCDCECHAEPDPADVLAWAIATGLYPAGATVEELNPPAFRAYKAEQAIRARAKEREQRRTRARANEAEKAAAADREFRAIRDRREAIREWAAKNEWPIGKGRIPAAVVEAYEVDQEDGAGQGALF
ncbi:Lsr2 family protein [Actinomadura sp. WAC 06369]|uniref:Lsr2 family protein n=1 Tax=Actinomadura sp. WAC 06369 TaxID=2203193 RepID=UPI000F77A0BF|nr:Lsr2 family protein [Actinomadura sp. WAC 06369]RSN46567.1 hypothetical protein DMH08_35725 [Actinomadura sp. WAC 06369]